MPRARFTQTVLFLGGVFQDMIETNKVLKNNIWMLQSCIYGQIMSKNDVEYEKTNLGLFQLEKIVKTQAGLLL